MALALKGSHWGLRPWGLILPSPIFRLIQYEKKSRTEKQNHCNGLAIHKGVSPEWWKRMTSCNFFPMTFCGQPVPILEKMPVIYFEGQKWPPDIEKCPRRVFGSLEFVVIIPLGAPRACFLHFYFDITLVVWVNFKMSLFKMPLLV